MARYYDPGAGRFITRDTFHGFEDEPQSLNQYAYCNNNPVMFIDPSGHFVTVVLGATIGALIALGTYELEVYLKMRTNRTSDLILNVAAGAALGAINGGIAGVGKLAGLASKAGMYAKDVKLLRIWLTAKNMVLTGIIKSSSRNDGESWFNYAKRLSRRLGLNF